ncbi:MAG: hypothetical protein K9G33_02270 [Sneathiella sp.]|nr:hypothetical protein [Sneathiella sp.]
MARSFLQQYFIPLQLGQPALIGRYKRVACGAHNPVKHVLHLILNVFDLARNGLLSLVSLNEPHIPGILEHCLREREERLCGLQAS